MLFRSASVRLRSSCMNFESGDRKFTERCSLRCGKATPLWQDDARQIHWQYQPTLTRTPAFATVPLRLRKGHDDGGNVASTIVSATRGGEICCGVITAPITCPSAWHNRPPALQHSKPGLFPPPIRRFKPVRRFCRAVLCTTGLGRMIRTDHPPQSRCQVFVGQEVLSITTLFGFIVRQVRCLIASALHQIGRAHV